MDRGSAWSPLPKRKVPRVFVFDDLRFSSVNPRDAKTPDVPSCLLLPALSPSLVNWKGRARGINTVWGFPALKCSSCQSLLVTDFTATASCLMSLESLTKTSPSSGCYSLGLNGFKRWSVPAWLRLPSRRLCLGSCALFYLYPARDHLHRAGDQQVFKTQPPRAQPS